MVKGRSSQFGSVVKSISLAACVVVMASCKGGDSSSCSLDSEQWSSGCFRDAETFRNQCNVLDENNFLRSWNNDTYLWYNEVTDRDPSLYSDPLDYFDLLVTDARTPSGNRKDRFHFAVDTDEWNAQSQSGISAGYGATFEFISTRPPREVVVAYVEPGSPADGVLMRGTRILSVDGEDLESSNNVDVLNAGLSPEVGETHFFEIRHPGSGLTIIEELTAEQITATPVQNVGTVETNGGTVGYIQFNDHNAISEDFLIAAIDELVEDNVTDLVLDLRYNSGGFLYIASQMSYMIAGAANTTGETFELNVFNDKHPTVNPVTGDRLTPTPFYNVSTRGEPLPSLSLNRVVILAGETTCSASESIINGLRGIDVEVILIGDTTCGKPYGFYGEDNCGYTYFTIQFQGENDKGFADFADGFSPENTNDTLGVSVPGCAVEDDFSRGLGDPQEAVFAAALQYLEDGTCPTPPAAAVGVNSTGQQKISGQATGENSGPAIEMPVRPGKILGRP